jgi:hypothetical protein
LAENFSPIQVTDIKEMFWRRAYNSEIYSCASESMRAPVGSDSYPPHPWLVVRFDYQGRSLIYAYSRNSSLCDDQAEASGTLTQLSQLPHHRHTADCCFLNKCGLVNLVRRTGRNDVRPIGDRQKLDELTYERGSCTFFEKGLAARFVKLFNSTRGGGIVSITSNYKRIGNES